MTLDELYFSKRSETSSTSCRAPKTAHAQGDFVWQWFDDNKLKKITKVRFQFEIIVNWEIYVKRKMFFEVNESIKMQNIQTLPYRSRLFYILLVK